QARRPPCRSPSPTPRRLRHNRPASSDAPPWARRITSGARRNRWGPRLAAPSDLDAGPDERKRMFALVCHVPFLLGPVKSGGADADRALNTALRIRFSTGLAGEPFLVAQPRMNDGLVSVSYDRSAERKILRR